MNNKEKGLREAMASFGQPSFAKWYDEHLDGKNQGDTIKDLVSGVSKNEITLEQALSCALIVGFQWRDNFNG